MLTEILSPAEISLENKDLVLILKHPGSRASFNFPAAENWEEKEALHKSCLFFEVAADQMFGLVSPDKTVFFFLYRGHYILGKSSGQNRAHSTKTETTFA